jgi:hypothetical protein
MLVLPRVVQGRGPPCPTRRARRRGGNSDQRLLGHLTAVAGAGRRPRLSGGTRRAGAGGTSNGEHTAQYCQRPFTEPRTSGSRFHRQFIQRYWAFSTSMNANLSLTDTPWRRRQPPSQELCFHPQLDRELLVGGLVRVNGGSSAACSVRYLFTQTPSVPFWEAPHGWSPTWLPRRARLACGGGDGPRCRLSPPRRTAG